MIVRPFISVGSMPDAAMLLGGRSSSDAIARINSRWAGDGGVVFQEAQDPFVNRFNEFKRIFVDVARETEHLLENAEGFITDKDNIHVLSSAEDLLHVPSKMHMPILTYAPIRKLFEEEVIYGWGHEPEDLPAEDEYGRVINNGYIGVDSLTGELPEYYEWHWKCDDPLYSMEELIDLARSREFVDTFILGQMESGEMLDPTDMLDMGIMSSFKE